MKRTTLRHDPHALVLVFWGKRGGGARYTFEIARALVEDLSAPRFAVSLNNENELLMLFKELAKESNGQLRLDVRHFSSGGRLSNWVELLAAPWAIASWCRRNVTPQGRVVIAMGNPLSLPLAAALVAFRVPFTHVVHDASSHPGESSALMMWSVKGAVRLAERVVVLSEYVRDSLVTGWRVRPVKIEVIPHGPFYWQEGQASIRSSEGGPTGRKSTGQTKVLFVGRILPYKGIPMLLDAWPAVRRSVANAELTIAGHGDTSEWIAKAKSAEGVLVENRWLEEGEIVSLMHQADVVVLPYLEASQSGVVGIAHSFGVPVVCTRVGGLAQQLHRSNGDQVCEPDPESVAKAIVEVIRNRPYGDSSASKAQISWKEIARRLTRN